MSGILVVDDDAHIRELLRHFLEAEGFVVSEAEDGAVALTFLRSVKVDLVVLDVMMPGLDGWTVCKEIKRRRDTPVLLLTARDTVRDRVRGLDAGADDYMVKPFERDELLARLRALIRRSASQAQPRLQIGSLVIDTAARAVSRRGQPVTLTAREYALLEFLALHRGKLVTRTVLYEHLMDETDDTLSNLLDVHVSNIRKKLGHGVIATRRGQGYCIE